MAAECIRVEHLGCHARGLLAHGGAGGWDERRAYRAVEAVREAARRGAARLEEPLLAVVEAVKSMEDSGVLNAGIGAVPSLDGSVELDAGLASSDGLIGAVAGVSLRNPILAALVVALETPHVLMAGRGAELLARSFGVEEHPGANPIHVKRLVEQKLRGDVLARVRGAKLAVLQGDTVGAVAVNSGVLTAGTSTGGVFGKLRGRVGDTPIYGAGFYADNIVACSATGIGETIILTMPCLRIALLAAETGSVRRDHVESVVRLHTKRFGCGNLGLILVDRRGCFYAATNAKMPIAFTDGARIEARMVSAVDRM